MSTFKSITPRAGGDQPPGIMKKEKKKMILSKGDKIRETKSNSNPMFENTTANSTLVYEVVRVNAKTYGLKCISGYMKGMGCNLLKSAPAESTDIYGTTTRREIIA